MKKEVLELALAYNFVTPYTAFLAVPESELGAMKQTLDEARAQKQKILASNPDAAGLKNQQSAGPADLAAATGVNGTTTTTQGAPDTSKAPMQTNTRTFTENFNSDDEEDAPRAKKDVADRDADGEDEEADVRAGGAAPMNSPGMDSKRHGCAGCASTGSDAGVFVLVFVGLVLRRRRRHV